MDVLPTKSARRRRRRRNANRNRRRRPVDVPPGKRKDKPRRVRPRKRPALISGTLARTQGEQHGIHLPAKTAKGTGLPPQVVLPSPGSTGIGIANLPRVQKLVVRKPKPTGDPILSMTGAAALAAAVAARDPRLIVAALANKPLFESAAHYSNTFRPILGGLDPAWAIGKLYQFYGGKAHEHPIGKVGMGEFSVDIDDLIPNEQVLINTTDPVSGITTATW